MPATGSAIAKYANAMADPLARQPQEDPTMANLTTPIDAAKRTPTPSYGITRLGYSTRSGAPTEIMVRLRGESRWRRLMIWQFSNAGTYFVKIRGTSYVVPATDLPEGI